MSWDGEERRKMNQDQINRDRLLSEVHTDMKHLVVWAKNHDKDDKDRFDAIDKRVRWAEKILYMAIGVFIIFELYIKYVS